MHVASITFKYDADKNITGYIVYIDGGVKGVQSFFGEVNLDPSELDLEFVAKLAEKKIAETFGEEGA